MEDILKSIESSEEVGYNDNTTSASDGGVEESSFISFLNALRRFATATADTNNDITSSNFATAAASTSPSSTTTTTDEDTATWLYETCTKVQTPLPTLQFTLEVLSAINSGDESKMQSSLFELFGEGEQSIDILFQVMGKADDMRRHVTEEKLKSIDAGGKNGAAAVVQSSQSAQQQQQHEQLQQLRSEAYEAANLVLALRSEVNALHNNQYNSRGTHSVTRKSDKEIEKTYKRAMKQAISTVANARKMGALTESDDIFLQSQLSTTNSGGGNGKNESAMEQQLRLEEFELYQQHAGLDGMTSQQIQFMKSNLLPEGTKQYSDASTRGLPKGTIRTIHENYEKVVIPPPIREQSLLRTRINLDDVLGEDTDERQAFVGCNSLNPMQSTVFDAAYGSRENLLICAPTGKLTWLTYGCMYVVYCANKDFFSSYHFCFTCNSLCRCG